MVTVGSESEVPIDCSLHILRQFSVSVRSNEVS